MADAGLHRTIPALPVREMGAAVAFYRERLGFAVLHHDAATDFGTREFATLDLDGNLLSFFRWESASAPG